MPDLSESESALSDAMVQYTEDPVLHAFAHRIWNISRADSTQGSAKYNYELDVLLVLAQFQKTLQDENRKLKAEVLRLTALVPAFILADLVPEVVKDENKK